jgi:hypothetical protein
MPPESFVDSELGTRLLKHLESLGYWSSRSQILKRIDEIRRTANASEYAHCLGDDPTPLYVIPGLEYFAGRHQDSILAGRGLVSFLFVERAFLEKHSMLDCFVEELLRAFRVFMRPFRPKTSIEKSVVGEFDAETIGADDADEFLEALLRYRVAYQEDSTSSYVLGRWASDTTEPASSATLLDFLLRVRLSTSHPPSVHRDQLIRALAFDAELARRHWNAASELVQATCDPTYVDAVLGVLCENGPARP